MGVVGKDYRVIADAAIPFVGDCRMPSQVELCRLPASQINADVVRDADALLVRTRTQCNSSLLEGSRVRLVASATMGCDHIDIPWCKERGIQVVNAPGCNAWGVVQWVVAGLAVVAHRLEVPIESLCVGIVGVGNAGGRLATLLRHYGMRVLLCDPPLAEQGGEGYVTLERVVQACDVITFHVPLTRSGAYPTYHYGGDALRSMLQGRRVVIMNSSRGEVLDEAMLLAAHAQGCVRAFLLDVYAHEPTPSLELVEKAWVSTPHIAGYTLEGKWRGTHAVLRALSVLVGESIELPDLVSLGYPPPPMYDDTQLGHLAASYFIEEDSDRLKRHVRDFEKLRTEYAFRREFTPPAEVSAQWG